MVGVAALKFSAYQGKHPSVEPPDHMESVQHMTGVR